ncbi:MAG: hypothetical protein ACR2JN_07465, partial [Lapillicoccus sp.]
MAVVSAVWSLMTRISLTLPDVAAGVGSACWRMVAEAAGAPVPPLPARLPAEVGALRDSPGTELEVALTDSDEAVNAAAALCSAVASARTAATHADSWADPDTARGLEVGEPVGAGGIPEAVALVVVAVGLVLEVVVLADGVVVVGVEVVVLADGVVVVGVVVVGVVVALVDGVVVALVDGVVAVLGSGTRVVGETALVPAWSDGLGARGAGEVPSCPSTGRQTVC